MKNFRKHVAIAIDGGGIRGVAVTRALSILEAHLQKPCNEIFQLTAGTSTGSIISAGIAAGLSATQMYDLYVELGDTIFKKSLRSAFWPLTRYRYPGTPLADALLKYIGNKKMGDFWEMERKIDVVITTFDLVENRTRFIKPWKQEYKDWSAITSVMASSTVPTYFPVVEGRYVDGGVGAYSNPCYLAAYELEFCLKWRPEETTLISLGTGRDPHNVQPGDPNKYGTLKWLNPILDAFLRSADDQQVHLVETFFKKLDFRRIQVDFKEKIEMDDPSSIPELIKYGDQMGHMLINDQHDRSMGVIAERLTIR